MSNWGSLKKLCGLYQCRLSVAALVLSHAGRHTCYNLSNKHWSPGQILSWLCFVQDFSCDTVLQLYKMLPLGETGCRVQGASLYTFLQILVNL